MPFLDALANPPSGPNRAFLIKGRVESISGFPLLGLMPPFELAVEPPNRLRIQFPLADTTVTACRNGQKIWAAPGSQIEAALSMLPQSPKPNAPNTPKLDVLPLLQIPFSGKQLELFPTLLQILPKGTAPFEGVSCNIVDVRLLPQLSQLLPANLDGWAMRMWISPQGKPVRLGIQRPGGSAVIRIDQIHFAPSLQPEIWTPSPSAIDIPLARLQALLNAFGKNLPAPK